MSLKLPFHFFRFCCAHSSHPQKCRDPFQSRSLTPWQSLWRDPCLTVSCPRATMSTLQNHFLNRRFFFSPFLLFSLLPSSSLPTTFFLIHSDDDLDLQRSYTSVQAAYQGKLSPPSLSSPWCKIKITRKWRRMSMLLPFFGLCWVPTSLLVFPPFPLLFLRSLIFPSSWSPFILHLSPFDSS